MDSQQTRLEAAYRRNRFAHPEPVSVDDQSQGWLQFSTLVCIASSVYYLGLKDSGSLCQLDSFPVLSVDAAVSK